MTLDMEVTQDAVAVEIEVNHMEEEGLLTMIDMEDDQVEVDREVDLEDQEYLAEEKNQVADQEGLDQENKNKKCR